MNMRHTNTLYIIELLHRFLTSIWFPHDDVRIFAFFSPFAFCTIYIIFVLSVSLYIEFDLFDVQQKHFYMPGIFALLHSAVSRHELFPIRAPLYTLEHCIGTFLDSCDLDDDHLITLKEWGNCTKLSEVRQSFSLR